MKRYIFVCWSGILLSALAGCTGYGGSVTPYGTVDVGVSNRSLSNQ